MEKKQNAQHQIKKGKTPRTTTGYSSSDASDDDTEARRRSDKFDLPNKGHRRGSKDGPPSGGGGGSSGGDGSAGGNNTGGGGGGSTGGNRNSTGSTNSGGQTNTDNNSGGGGGGSSSGNNQGNNYEKKRSNELRESLKTSNLSVNSNSSSTYSMSKYVIDPNNTTPSDSEDQESSKSWSRKESNVDLDQVEGRLYIIPKVDSSTGTNSIGNHHSSNRNHLKRDISNMSDKLINTELNSHNGHTRNGRSKHKDIRKKRNRIGSTECETSAKENSNCCRLI